ncbi:MAG: hypothetical protein IKZ86_06555 [Spirochaetaceae bacterium]|nr:hypothetical protein [Spirochaetaceae bacterium]
MVVVELVLAEQAEAVQTAHHLVQASTITVAMQVDFIPATRLVPALAVTAILAA